MERISLPPPLKVQEYVFNIMCLLLRRRIEGERYRKMSMFCYCSVLLYLFHFGGVSHFNRTERVKVNMEAIEYRERNLETVEVVYV